MRKDMKDWLIDRVNEIACGDFYNLSETEQNKVWAQAEEDWVDRYAAMIDAARSRKYV